MGQAQITIRLDYSLDSGAQGRVQPYEGLIVPVAGSLLRLNTQQVGIVEEPLELGDVSAGGLLWAINRGGAGTWVDMRAESGGPNLIRFRPGIPGLLPGLTPGATPYLIASEDRVPLEVFTLEV